uniref:Procyclic form-specific polypeptide B-alpha-like isoform X2 n=1 Tax=Phascolarctos cinereus TaxID=38626 RepID=A0A6P5JS99_PHACI|nr:procyclic form-specific polypeptide B-alpha-like isoform X2 [Phascolarctos cinereus]
MGTTKIFLLLLSVALLALSSAQGTPKEAPRQQPAEPEPAPRQQTRKSKDAEEPGDPPEGEPGEPPEGEPGPPPEGEPGPHLKVSNMSISKHSFLSPFLEDPRPCLSFETIWHIHA